MIIFIFKQVASGHHFQIPSLTPLPKTASVPPHLVPAESSRSFQSHCKIQPKTLQQNCNLFVLQTETVGIDPVSHLAMPLLHYQGFFREGSELICSGVIAVSVALALEAVKPAQSRSR